MPVREVDAPEDVVKAGDHLDHADVTGAPDAPDDQLTIIMTTEEAPRVPGYQSDTVHCAVLATIQSPS